MVKLGTVANFDLGVRTRDPAVGLVFAGLFEAPQAGLYRFWTKSDDGSKLWIQDVPLRLTVLGAATLPAPQRIFPGELLREEQEDQWAELEGRVNFVRAQSQSTCLELSSGAGLAYLRVLDASQDSLGLFLHCRIKCAGIYQTARALDGKTVSSLLVPGLEQMAITEMDPARWIENPVVAIASLTCAHLPAKPGAIVHLKGTVCSNAPGESLMIEDGTGRISIATSQAPPALGDELEVLGWCGTNGGGAVVESAFTAQWCERRMPPRKACHCSRPRHRS